MANVSNPCEERYKEVLELINALCEAYDTQKSDVIALSISTAIRVLVHDTEQSTSLLKHIKKKESQYLSTFFNDARERVTLGLVRRINVGVNDGVGGEAKYWPLCDERHFASSIPERYLDFDTWWEKEQIFKSSEASLTRKDLVLSVSNKDGGAHFDTHVAEKYDYFRKTWSGGSSLVGINSGTKRGYDNIPTYPAVRQIAHELLLSL